MNLLRKIVDLDFLFKVTGKLDQRTLIAVRIKHQISKPQAPKERPR